MEDKLMTEPYHTTNMEILTALISMQQDTIPIELSTEERELQELQVLQIVDKDILICKYLLGSVNYRSVDEAIDFLFWREQDSNKLRHEFIAGEQ